MSLIATFLWKKSPQTIATFVFDDETIQIIRTPQIFYLPKKLKFLKKEIIKIVTDFIKDLEILSKEHARIIVEYKIVFKAESIPWITLSPESKYVYKKFIQAMTISQTNCKQIKLKPQLRKKLSGKALKYLKQELQKMELVSGKRTRGFEYHLWMIALHATAKTYRPTLKKIKQRLFTYLLDHCH